VRPEPRLTSLLALILAPAAVAQSLTIEPAWGGRFAPGYPTVIEVTLISPVGGTAQVTASCGTSEIRAQVAVEAGDPTRLNLPLTPGLDGALRVSARLPDGDQTSAVLALDPMPSGPAPATTLATPLGATPALTVEPGRLARHPWGYGPVRDLTLSPADLRRLDGPQTAALAAYLAQCRPLHLVGAGAETLTGIRRASGCSGVAVGSGDLQGTPTGSSQAPALPGDDPLAALVPQTAGASALALMLLPYPILLLALAWRPGVGSWLVAIPPGAALAFGLALPWGVPGPRVAVWSEMDAGDPSVRYAAICELAGRGSPAGFPLPGASRVRPLDGGGLALVADATGVLTLAPPLGPSGGLLQTRRYRVEGVTQAQVQIALSVTGPDSVSLDNPGPEAVPAGWLLWQGQAQPTPALAPGRQTLTLAGPKVPAPVAQVPVPQPLRDRAGLGPALLLPWASPLPGAGAAWLLIRSGGEAPE
jgi:hypothetical protein